MKSVFRTCLTISDKIKFYTSRYEEFCAGNSQLANHLNPAPVLFGSFNIQVFGTTKYGKTEVKNQIVEILRRYDISTIQVRLLVICTVFGVNPSADSVGWSTYPLEFSLNLKVLSKLFLSSYKKLRIFYQFLVS